ncbi:hypothetical protein ACF5W4_11290 [Bacillota bacterium Lsc_1132]
MLINKPQFDMQALAPGTPVKVTASNWQPCNGSYAWAAIVTEYTPLTITVARYNSDRDEEERFTPGYRNMEFIELEVDSVAAGHIKIEKLVVAKGEN